MRILKIKKIITVGICAFAFSFSLQAQSLESARALYKQGKYAQALPIFKIYIAKQPNNASLNQWYGACLYETGNYADAEKYLKFAASRNIQESYRYLGEYYFLQYRFAESLENLDKYKLALEKNKQVNPKLELQIEQAMMGAKMIERVEKVQIIDSMIVDKTNFFEQYKLSSESGTFHNANAFFDSKDKGKEGMVYQNQRTDKIVYSSKSTTGKYNLYSRLKTSDGNWGEELPMPKNINTKGNENYPFLLSDGITLYYASDGANSLGGYDIFVTRLNLNSGNYLNPENLGMPFNSPYNDYLLAIDETNNVGWFVSDRFQPENKVIIYLFIPNTEKQIYRELPDAELRDLARITSIRATWGKNAKYDELLQTVYNTEEKIDNTKEAQFIFPIQDKLIYTNIADFRSEEAKNFYIKAEEIEKHMAQLNTLLAQKRQLYIQNKGKNNTLKNEILSMEETLLSLYGKPETFFVKARNSEIQFFQTNKKK